MVPGFATIQVAGDPVVRGLTGQATLMTTADVEQGVTASTNIGSALSAMSSRLDQFFTSGPAFTDPTGPLPPPSTTPDTGTATPLTNPDASQTSGSSVDCSNISGSDMLLHPVDSLNCLLNRFLFGLVALVLLGFGLYLFAKD